MRGLTVSQAITSTSLFEDREGNIWVATIDGLDRFRDFAVPTISVKQGLSNATVWSVLAARDGSVWLGTRDGLNRWNDGQITIYRKRSSGLPDDTVESLFQDDHGRIWVSTHRGVAYFENGRFIPVSAVPGGYVHSIAGDGAGNLWISRPGSGSFSFASGECGRTDSLGQAGTEGLRLCSAPRSVAGRPMAWILSGWRGVFQGRSGPRIVREPPMGWARAVSTTFNSIGTVHSGPQPRAG